MTNSEIEKIIGIPSSTLGDWKKKTGWRLKLLMLLHSLNSENTEKTITSSFKQNNPFFHILNRNISKKSHYTKDDVIKAFSIKANETVSTRDAFVHSRFFKECRPEDLDEFKAYFEITKKNIKEIYLRSCERKTRGVDEIWHNYFKLKQYHTNEPLKNSEIPEIAKILLEERGEI
jgi:hypothetical protein